MEKVFLFLWRQHFARKVAGSIRFLIISWLLYSSDSNLSPLPTKIFDLCLVGSWQFLYGMCNELLELVLELSNFSLISRLFECSLCPGNETNLFLTSFQGFSMVGMVWECTFFFSQSHHCGFSSWSQEEAVKVVRLCGNNTAVGRHYWIHAALLFQKQA